MLRIELLLANETSRDSKARPFSNSVFAKPSQKALLRKQSRKIVDVLHHNLRITDEKGVLGVNQYGVLLVDTPEMGGRAVLDRMTNLMNSEGLNVKLSLQVHDPEGFGDQEDDQFQNRGPRPDRRREDGDVENWVRKRIHQFDDLSKSQSIGKASSKANEDRVFIDETEFPRTATWGARLTKRTIDILGAGTGLILTSPVLFLSMIAIKCLDGGPVLFTQTREGQHGRPFTIYKLRSMVVDAEKSQAALRSSSHRDGPAFKITRDPRVTKLGRFLRATCLDELPQLINVLIGDMSLVGPRPLPWHESRACERWHRRRLDVRPGITCIWQVNKTKAVTFDDWMRMDLRYIDRRGLFQDLRLIAKTVIVPVSGRGGE